MEYIAIIGLGLCFIMLGIYNIKGNISSIHWYNRTKVTTDDSFKYARFIGIGTVVIGSGMIVTEVLKLIFDIEEIAYLLILVVVVGLIFILYAQIKYNKGLF